MDWIVAHPVWTAVAVMSAIVVAVAIYDIRQPRRAIVHNFPVLGHLRYFFESIGPEIRQYFIAQDKEELPFSRDERRWIYATSKGANNTFGFGTNEQIYGIGYPIIKHSAFPVPEVGSCASRGRQVVVPVAEGDRGGPQPVPVPSARIRS